MTTATFGSSVLNDPVVSTAGGTWDRIAGTNDCALEITGAASSAIESTQAARFVAARET